MANWKELKALMLRGTDLEVTAKNVAEVTIVTRPVLGEVMAAIVRELDPSADWVEDLQKRLGESYKRVKDGKLNRIEGQRMLNIGSPPAPQKITWHGKETKPTKDPAYYFVDEACLRFDNPRASSAYVRLWVSISYNESDAPSVLRIAIGADGVHEEHRSELEHELWHAIGRNQRIGPGHWIAKRRGVLQNTRIQVECSITAEEMEKLGRDLPAAFRGMGDGVFLPAYGAMKIAFRKISVDGKGAGEPEKDGTPDRSSVGDTEMKKLADILVRFKNLVLEGVPGTGKTYAFNKMLEELGDKDKAADTKWHSEAITFHPSTSYEDFVEGLRPASRPGGTNPPGEERKVIVADEDGNESSEKEKNFFDPVEPVDDDKGGWQVVDGFFLRVCAEAARNPEKKYSVLLDELNRANVPKVMGDLLTVMEYSKRAICKESSGDKVVWKVKQSVTLPNSGRIFFVPDNVYIVATMNTTDRSVARLDAALRRRFVFKRLEPMVGKDLIAALEKDLTAKLKKATPEIKERLEPEVKRWAELNKLLWKELGPDAMLGHSYFFDMEKILMNATKEKYDEIVRSCWELDILPQLVEVFNLTRPMDEVLTKLLEPINKQPDGLGLTIKKAGKGLLESYLVAPQDPPKKPDPSADNGDTSSTVSSAVAGDSEKDA